MDELRQPPLNSSVSAASFNKSLGANFYGADDVDLNDALQTSLTKQAAEQNAILRSDKLPVVSGDKQSFDRLFDAIIFMIVNHPPVNSKLFLYVKCEEEKKDPEVLDLRFSEAGRLYNLYFHTNITTDDNWKMVHQEQLLICTTIAKENKGSFCFHPISNTGCLFSLTLPGKNS